MSYNTRRGGGTPYNKNMSSSNVGSRRPIVTNNYVPNPPPQKTGTQQSQNPGYSTQQHVQRQQNHGNQQISQGGAQTAAQQQLARQQQMLVQKKQQFAQQQRQQQNQKTQVIQQQRQQPQIAQKSQDEQKELELQRQRELEHQRRLEQQKQLEIDQQRQLEEQRQLELQKQLEQKKRELEQKELEKQRQIELEQQKQRELDLLKKAELERKDKLNTLQNNVSEIQMELNQSNEAQSAENGSIKPERRKWTPRKRLPKYEIQRRRNMKLSKLLQPKNAMVILNEVVKNISYIMEEFQSFKGHMIKATVVVDGVQHEGFGPNKMTAKNNCAEKCLQYLVKHKKLMHLQPQKTIKESEVDGIEPMETAAADDAASAVDETNQNNAPLAWQQFASFAVYKLLTAWGEDPTFIKEDARPIKKPARKMPPNANLMNPMMLLNQMLPDVKFEEMPISSNGRFNTFNYKCTIEEKTFFGSATSKKVAKRQAAFAVCKDILGIEYPPEVYNPSEVKEAPVN